MTCIPQTWKNHGLRLTPIETDLQTVWPLLICSRVSLQRMKFTGQGVPDPADPGNACSSLLTEQASEQTTVVVVVLLTAGGMVTGQLLEQTTLHIVDPLGQIHGDRHALIAPCHWIPELGNAQFGRVSTVPGWVPAGISSSLLPSTVSTSMVSPRIAWR